MKQQNLRPTKNAIASSSRESAIARNSPHPLEELQGAIGNHAVNQLLANQPPLTAKPIFRGLSPEFRSDLTQINQPIQAKEADSPSVEQAHTENKTGLPGNLKVGIENLSGIAMDDVRVHYNSFKPYQLQALAYTQGTDIHVAPAQEQHLPHEAWHVVQQKQGRVKPTIQTKGVRINNDQGLEKEADVMGSKALQMKNDKSTFEVLDNSPEAVAQTKISDMQARQVTVPQGKDIPINADFQLEYEADVLGTKVAQAETVSAMGKNTTVRLGIGNNPVQCVSTESDLEDKETLANKKEEEKKRKLSQDLSFLTDEDLEDYVFQKARFLDLFENLLARIKEKGDRGNKWREPIIAGLEEAIKNDFRAWNVGSELLQKRRELRKARQFR
ncbi:hypothetical protein NIES2107_11270 [Nostoc carneum NIES-2107]|nr:hypothetical protein NIES2107_11270 [Nostoc carneum NIES-2107]